MANTVVQIEIPEADVTRVVKAVCKRAGVEVLPANAKPALAKIIKAWVVAEQQSEAAITPPNLT